MVIAEAGRGLLLACLSVPQFSEALNSIWCYYEAFLGQTLMLNAEPIRDLANTFINLKVCVSLPGVLGEVFVACSEFCVTLLDRNSTMSSCTFARSTSWPQRSNVPVDTSLEWPT